MKDYIYQCNDFLKEIKSNAKKNKLLTGVCISNTSKIDSNGFYFTPIRSNKMMIVFGVIVYKEKQAVEISKIVDGKVNYVLVDAEKKISDNNSLTGEPANIERCVRETIKKSKLWIYKANDLSVDAIDSFLAEKTKKNNNGIGGLKVTILGAGNIGCKLALRLVERGAQVILTRRNYKKLVKIVEALNIIKPYNTTSTITGLNDNELACMDSSIVVGTTNGNAVINKKIINNLANDAFIIDVGKGSFHPNAIKIARNKNINIYRLDISAAFDALIYKLSATEELFEKKCGRRYIYNENLISGGLLAF